MYEYVSLLINLIFEILWTKSHISYRKDNIVHANQSLDMFSRSLSQVKLL